ncbi:MAG: TolB protein [Paraglaciecola sp.]
MPDTGTNDLDPRFSPDGSKVIFTNANNDGISVKNILIMTIEGKGRTLFFEDSEMADWW